MKSNGGAELCLHTDGSRNGCWGLNKGYMHFEKIQKFANSF